MSIQFEEDWHWNADLLAITFWARTGAQTIRCRVSREFVSDHFGGSSIEEIKQQFQAHRPEIERIFSQRIAEGHVERARDGVGEVFLGTNMGSG